MVGYIITFICYSIPLVIVPTIICLVVNHEVSLELIVPLSICSIILTAIGTPTEFISEKIFDYEESDDITSSENIIYKKKFNWGILIVPLIAGIFFTIMGAVIILFNIYRHSNNI